MNWRKHHSSSGSRRLGPCHTTLITLSLIRKSVNHYVYLIMVPGDEFLTTQSTGIWIVPGMNLHVSLYIVLGYEIFTTKSDIINRPGVAGAVLQTPLLLTS